MSQSPHNPCPLISLRLIYSLRANCPQVHSLTSPHRACISPSFPYSSGELDPFQAQLPQGLFTSSPEIPPQNPQEQWLLPPQPAPKHLAGEGLKVALSRSVPKAATERRGPCLARQEIMALAGVTEFLLQPKQEVANLHGVAQGSHEPLICHPAMFMAQARVGTGPKWWEEAVGRKQTQHENKQPGNLGPPSKLKVLKCLFLHPQMSVYLGKKWGY